MIPLTPNSLDAWEWDSLPLHVDVVLAIWWSTLKGDSPWKEMTPDDSLGRMRGVVSELLNEARNPPGEKHVLRLERLAGEHGEYRRLQHCRPNDLVREFEALSLAIQQSLELECSVERLVHDSLVVLQPDIRAATLAAAQGWLARNSISRVGAADC